LFEFSFKTEVTTHTEINSIAPINYLPDKIWLNNM
jgi:hypothetical protein